MSFKEILPILLKVLKDWRVIVTVVAMLFVMEFAKFVVNYKKKPPRPVKVKKVATAPATQTEEGGETESTGGGEEATEE